MIYRTLHSYILRELLRVFLLTASAFTTLLAFGGTFRPVTKQGIEVSQVMVIIINLMPAMLAYAIPVAALFAAVLVYWRMSTDNELTACRAGGISFIAMVIPAFILGIVVASVDLVFVNYVVPRFLQSTERAVQRDLGGLIVSQISRQEKFEWPGKVVVYADRAELEKSDPDSDVTVVVLHGMAGTWLEGGKPSRTVLAEEARLTIRNVPFQDYLEIDVRLKNATAFDPRNAFQRITGSIESLSPDGRPFRFPSLLKSKPKFANWRSLAALAEDPSTYPPVGDELKKIQQAYDYQQITKNIADWWNIVSKSGTVPVTFTRTGLGGSATSATEIILSAKSAAVDAAASPQESLHFAGPIRVDEREGGKLVTSYTCDAADMILLMDEVTGTGITASLQLRDNVRMQDHERDIPSVPKPSQMISGLQLDPALKIVPPPPGTSPNPKVNLLEYASKSPQADLRAGSIRANAAKQKLDQTILSELNSRGSFSLSCLTLVLFGAALGIMLRGKNPLAVFVLGFVPAVLLVLLITAGRQLTEGDFKNVRAGITMIWAGNVILLLLVAGVYLKLLRR